MEKISLYEYNILTFEEQLKIVWDRGVFLQNYLTKKERANLYALDKFFVEVHLNNENKFSHIRTFKDGDGLDRHVDLWYKAE